jgi:pseudaminic acid biosynthesis-associated methylase
LKNNFSSEQENFWSGEFGSDYIDRNRDSLTISSNLVLFSKIINQMKFLPKDTLEIGANIGLNISALKLILPNSNFTGLEINRNACESLSKTGAKVINDSVFNVSLDQLFDLVFTKGVLIHLDPERIQDVYEKLYNWSRKYILLIEYFNPSPVKIEYRGFENKLFKRDFAGEMLDKFKDLKLVDYGFVYSRSNFPQDDVTWFLLEKN